MLLPAFILYLMYKIFIKWLRSFIRGKNDNKNKNSNIKDMKRDPVCGIYIPISEAKKVKSGGEFYYFCSDKCREKFIELKKTDPD